MMKRPKYVENKRCSAQRKKTRIWSRRDGDCVVYCLTNRINGRMYVGYTSKSVFERWGESGKEYKGHCPAIWAAIEKYSWSNFEKRILVDHLDEETAKEIEKVTISFLKERGNRLYNLTDGGDSSPMKNPEVAAKVSQAMKGKNNPMRRPEVAAKQRESLKVYFKNNPEKNPMKRPEVVDKNTAAKSKPVEALDPHTGRVIHCFKSTMDAGRAGFHQGHISECCNNKQKTHRNLIWRFAKLEPDQTE